MPISYKELIRAREALGTALPFPSKDFLRYLKNRCRICRWYYNIYGSSFLSVKGLCDGCEVVKCSRKSYGK